MARKGDLITVTPRRVGGPGREGEIIEVIEGDLRVQYRVRWNDGHESLFAPGAGAARTEAARDRKKTAASMTKTKKSPAKADLARKSRAKAAPARKALAREVDGQEVDGQEVDASNVEREGVNSKADPCPQTFGTGDDACTPRARRLPIEQRRWPALTAAEADGRAPG